MKVFKFGGASVKDAASFKNVASILSAYQDEDIVLVLSALGKTTNKLESILEAHYMGGPNAKALLSELISFHLEIVHKLFTDVTAIVAELNDLFVEIEWILEDEPHSDYNYEYDQLVSFGELFSTRILSGYLNEIGLSNHWLDARNVILTDNSYRRANVNWAQTELRIVHQIPPLLAERKLVITQGFIGCTSENYNSTLGREGSDFSAGVFSYALNAESLSIWKDVPGILTGDPRRLEDVVKIEHMSYREAIEMTYYGAKVIHPKTIKPLQNKGISLFVRSFKNPEEHGTEIKHFEVEPNYPPVIVIEDDQCLINISTKDFSFIAEKHLSGIFTQLAEYGISVRLMRNTAISFTICSTYEERKMNKLIDFLQEDFNVELIPDLQLVTVRHYNLETIEKYRINRKVLFEEQLSKMVQLVLE